jgi:type IV fimbrial biogenesis protein FimT
MLARRARGFTLIELMIGLVLLGVLLVLAMPSFSQMLQNMKLRTTAETILTGLQSARAEALKRNQRVEFLLTADDVDAGNWAALAPNAAGPGWAVRVDPAVCDAANLAECFVDGRSGVEGSNQSDATSLSTQIAATSLPADGLIRFDALGRSNVTDPAGAVFAVTNPSGGACSKDGGEMRCLNIVVTASGRVRMCDPAVAPAAGETRAC